MNWLLARGYHVYAKDYSGRHARSLAKSVLVWFDDPHIPERQAGWVTEARHLPMCAQWCALPCAVANRTDNGLSGS